MNLEKLIAQVEALTEDNHHTAAVKEIARAFDQVTTAKILTHIEQIAALVGSMPHQLIEYRAALTGEMLADIEKTHGRDVMEKLYGTL